MGDPAGTADLDTGNSYKETPAFAQRLLVTSDFRFCLSPNTCFPKAPTQTSLLCVTADISSPLLTPLRKEPLAFCLPPGEQTQLPCTEAELGFLVERADGVPGLPLFNVRSFPC